MPQRQIVQTSDAGLRFEFLWPESPIAAKQFGPTYGELAAHVGKQSIWAASSGTGHDRGIPGVWIELLEYLSDYWLYLVLEQGYPFHLSPAAPSDLDRELERRWESMSDSGDAANTEEEEVYSFKLTHNLAEASPGTVRPDLWLVRDGGLYVVEAKCGTTTVVEHFSAVEIKRVLAGVGDAIAQRLAQATDERSKTALHAWSHRESRDARALAKIATGLSDDYLQETCGARSFESVFADPVCSWLDDNLCVDLAYRCKGVIPPESLRMLLDRVRTAHNGTSEELRRISSQACGYLNPLEVTLPRPYQQGRALAKWLRADLANPSGRVEPEQLLSTWAVIVDGYDFSTRYLDAVACWAHNRQPTILWNRSEKNLNNEGARRAAVSHEICHLLVDRSLSLPLTAVVGGAMDRRLERRANAFAAEFLCPQREAGAEYRQNPDVPRTIERLTRRFGVSNQLAALQLAQSGEVADAAAQKSVESFGPSDAYYPWRR